MKQAYDLKMCCTGIALLVSFCKLLAAPPVIQNVTDNRSLFAGGNVPLFNRFEISFSLDKSYQNIFDSTQINVYATFVTPSGATIVLPGFYYEDYIRSGDASQEIVDKVAGSGCWKIRFAPRATGTYSYTISVTDAGGTTSSSGSFTCVQAAGKGFITRNGSQLLFDNGGQYWAAGTTSPWFQPSKWGDGTFGAEHHYGLQMHYGGNWDRLWIDVGSWASPSIEAERPFWNFWTPTNSASVDTLLTNVHSGIYSCKISYTGGTTNDVLVRWSRPENWQVQAGKHYTLSVWIKTQNVTGASGGGACISSDYGLQVPQTPATGTADFTQYSTTFTASSNGRIDPILHLKNATGTCWFDDLSLKENGTGEELGEDVGFERSRFQAGAYGLDESWKLDRVLSIAESCGVYVNLMIGHSGDSPNLYKRYNRYLVARYGAYRSLLSWEMCNENCFDVDVIDTWSTYVASIDPYNHPRTTSFWNGLIVPSIWMLPHIDIVQMHRYPNDQTAGTDWAIDGTGAFDLTAAHAGSRSIKFTANGGDAGSASISSGARPGAYTLTFWAKGQSVSQTNWTAPAGMVVFYDSADQVLATFPSNANSNSSDLDGTYDWKQLSYTATAPAKTVRLDLSARGGFLGSNATLWFDELSLKDPDGREVPLDYNFEVTDYYDDIAMVMFKEGRRLNGAAFGKPVWYGELGIEDADNAVAFSMSPYHDSDATGIILHQFLWGALCGKVMSTGTWWYLINNMPQLQGISTFLASIGGIPATLRSVSYLDRNPELSTSSSSLRALGLLDAHRAIVYIYNKDYIWGRLLKNHITPAAVSGASVTIKTLQNGIFAASWLDPQTAQGLSSTQVTVANNSITVPLPAALDKDIALYLTDGPAPVVAKPDAQRNRLLSNLRISTGLGKTFVLRYSLRSMAMVRIKLYDISGKLAASLDQGMQNSGSHCVIYAGGAAKRSGMYIVDMRAQARNALESNIIRKAVMFY